MKRTFEQQQELNRIRDTAMRVACSGFTTEQLKAVNPTLIASLPDVYEALKDIVEQADKTRVMLPADLADSIRVFGKQALAKAGGG